MLHYCLSLVMCNVVAVRSYEFAIRPMYGDLREGYVEMNINGTWSLLSYIGGTMSAETVRILCRTLGFGSTGFTTHTYKEMNITGHVLFGGRSINCNGNELYASECVIGSSTNSNNWMPMLPKGTTILHCFAYYVTDIRLYGGVLPHEGRLEVKVGNRWGAVCIHYYDSSPNNNAICSLLGYAEDSVSFTSTNFADNIAPVEYIWMTTLRCGDTDNNINQCYFGIEAPPFCPGSQYVVTLKCEPAKIVNGTTPNSGIIEVSLFGKLQMVCGSSGFSTEAANVTCNVLGYRSVGALSAVKPFVDSTGDVFSGSIQCDGTEQSLEMCDIVQEHSVCHDPTVIYIECLGGPIDIIPIGKKSNEGIFTMYNWKKVWVIVESPYREGGISNTTAKTLCYLLGHGYEGSKQHLSELPVNVSLTEYKTLDALDCHGNESDIAQCRRRFFYSFPCKGCPGLAPGGFTLISCTECPPGKFGTHCTECNCNNRSKVPCDTETGECTCKAGWSGTSCELDIDECVTQTVCPINSDCTNVPGSYQCVCKPGFKLTGGICSVFRYTEKTTPNSDMLVIILSSVIGGLALISIIATGCLCKNKMKGKKTTSHCCRPGQDHNLSSMNKSEELSTIDHHSLHTEQELTSTETNPYDTIDNLVRPTSDRIVKSKDRPEICRRPALNQMNMNNKDDMQMTDKKDSEYPYPSVIHTDEDGYLKLGKAGNIQTEERKNSPYINADAKYQPLSHLYRSEHDYHLMKH